MAAEAQRAPRVARGQTNMALAAAALVDNQAAMPRGAAGSGALLRHLQLRGAA